jgi:hypothetical protein
MIFLTEGRKGNEEISFMLAPIFQARIGATFDLKLAFCASRPFATFC